MRRGFLHVLSAACCTALLAAAAPSQSAGGDQLVRAKGGEYSLRVPAAWKIMVNVNGVDAGGDRVRMKLYFVEMVLSLSRSMGGIVQANTQNWKNVTLETDDKTSIGGNRAEVSIIHGVNEDGVRAVRRAALFNPLPPDRGTHTYAFLFDVAESDWARSLPLIQRIEESFRVGTAQPATVPPATKKAAPPPGPAPVMPPELPEPEPAGAAASTYRDPQGRFQIPVPPGWTADQAGDGARISRGSAYANVLVVDGASSPSALVQQIAQQVGTQWKNFRMVQNGQWNLGGLPAEYGVFTGTNPRGVPALLRILATSGFVLLMSVPQNDWEALKADLRQIEGGFSTSRAPGGRAFLGVSCRDVNTEDMWASGGATKQGAVVGEISPGSPAQKAGFRIGDTIISVDRQAVKGVRDLVRLVAAHRPGDMVEIVVERGGKPLEFMVSLAGRP